MSASLAACAFSVGILACSSTLTSLVASRTFVGAPAADADITSHPKRATERVPSTHGVLPSKTSRHQTFWMPGKLAIGLGVTAFVAQLRRRKRLTQKRPAASLSEISAQTVNEDVTLDEPSPSSLSLFSSPGSPRPAPGYVEELVAPVLASMLASFVLYPAATALMSGTLDSTALGLIKGDVSQYMQNYFNFNGLLFSFFASQTYAVLYQQQESLYQALFAEMAEARSLLEQLTLVSQSRPSYPLMLRCMSAYVDNLVLGVRLGCPPAVLVSAQPVNDPLERILYLTSVGAPSVVYDTVRSLRQARGVRLGCVQRKLPSEHFALLYGLGILELLTFPFLGAGVSTFEPLPEGFMPGHILFYEAFVFSILVGAIVCTIRLIQDLTSPTSGLYNMNDILDEMVGGLRSELATRLRNAPSTDMLDLDDPGGTAPEAPVSGVKERRDMWMSMQPQAEDSQQVQRSLVVGMLATLAFPVAVLFLKAFLSDPTLQSIREDNNAQWLQNVFTGMGFIFSLFVAQTFGFLYSQQEAIYLALYSEVSEAKALLEQLTLVCRTRPSYCEMLKGLQYYVREDLERLDTPPTTLLSRPQQDPLEKILYLTSVGIPSAVYQTVLGLRTARGQRLGATQRKLPDAHFVLLAVVGALELTIFPVLSAGCSALDPFAYLPGHILPLHSVLFGLMTAALTLVFLVIQDVLNPFGGTYNIKAIAQEMCVGLEEELQIRLVEHDEVVVKGVPAK